MSQSEQLALDSILRKIAIQTACAQLAVRRIEQAALTQKIESTATPPPEKAAACHRLVKIELESRRLEDELELLIAENEQIEP